MTESPENQPDVSATSDDSNPTKHVRSIADLERELQSVRLEMEKLEEDFKRQSQDFEVYKRNQFDVVKEQVDFAFEILFTDIAANASLLQTLTHKLDTQGETTIQAKDVLRAAKTVVSQLENHGLELMGKIGDIVGFDKNIHELCGSFEEISQSEKVTVIIVGVSFRGKILRRIGVMSTPETREALDT